MTTNSSRSFIERAWEKLPRSAELHPKRFIVFIVLAALIPFLTKPFNMDDPLFIWAAHQIKQHPSDPYGFQVNWYGSLSPMYEVTKNPPLACYYLALVASILGWSETAIH